MHEDKPEVSKDLDILHEHFKNIKCVNIEEVMNLSISEIVDLIKTWKINYISFGDIYLNSKHEYSISSEAGCLVLYDQDVYQYIKFSKICLLSNSRYCETLGEYVIFKSNDTKLELSVEELCEYVEDYDSLDLTLIDQSAIIIHKKYIHKLHIKNDLDFNLDFVPTRSLKLDILSYYRHKSGGLAEYLNTHSLHKVFAEVTFGS